MFKVLLENQTCLFIHLLPMAASVLIRAEGSSCSRDLRANKAKIPSPLRSLLIFNPAHSNLTLLEFCTLSSVSEGFFLIAVLETLLLIYPFKTLLEPGREKYLYARKHVHSS